MVRTTVHRTAVPGAKTLVTEPTSSDDEAENAATTTVRSQKIGGATVTTTKTQRIGKPVVTTYGTPGTVTSYATSTHAPKKHFAYTGSKGRGVGVAQRYTPDRPETKSTLRHAGGFTGTHTVTRQVFTPAPPLPPCSTKFAGCPAEEWIKLQTAKRNKEIAEMQRKKRGCSVPRSAGGGGEDDEGSNDSNDGTRTGTVKSHGRIAVLRKRSSSSW